jgi:predicted nuclease of predicted toxin-antitoxin system
MVRFLADECIFEFTVKFLRSKGLDVTTIRQIGLCGAKDREVLSKAQEMGAVLITRDMDFCDIRKFPPSAS